MTSLFTFLSTTNRFHVTMLKKSKCGEKSTFLFLTTIDVICDTLLNRTDARSTRVTWANIPQLKVGNIRGYSPIFKTDSPNF